MMNNCNNQRISKCHWAKANESFMPVYPTIIRGTSLDNRGYPGIR